MQTDLDGMNLEISRKDANISMLSNEKTRVSNELRATEGKCVAIVINALWLSKNEYKNASLFYVMSVKDYSFVFCSSFAVLCNFTYFTTFDKNSDQTSH